MYSPQYNRHDITEWVLVIPINRVHVLQTILFDEHNLGLLRLQAQNLHDLLLVLFPYEAHVSLEIESFLLDDQSVVGQHVLDQIGGSLWIEDDAPHPSRRRISYSPTEESCLMIVAFGSPPSLWDHRVAGLIRDHRIAGIVRDHRVATKSGTIGSPPRVGPSGRHQEWNHRVATKSGTIGSAPRVEPSGRHQEWNHRVATKSGTILEDFPEATSFCNVCVTAHTMKFYLLATLVSVASASTVAVYPPGVDPRACPNFPVCSVEAPAAFPIPVINGQNVAPVLNTLPDQTLFYQQAQLVKSPADFPTPIINGEAVAPVLNTVPAQTRAVENHQLIAAQQQLEQLKAQQIIQIRQQQQEIEAARHFGRL
eukprot:maker-scaffold159_size295958-snap-gene-1.31 protein:Tk05089 transcript:maker-scaffold159_size295958-snap-gene-1.31-mRNA-1 annotation:"sporulation regulator"